MTEKKPLELLEETKDAIDFQLVVANSTDESTIRLTKEHAYVCLIAVERMISIYKPKEGTDDE